MSHQLNNFKMKMVAEAQLQFGNISPVFKANGDWDKSFSQYGKSLYLWFNTTDHNTHCLKAIKNPLSQEYEIIKKCPECNAKYTGNLCQCKKIELQ